MLEGLDQIQWSELSHAYGPAADVPDLLRDLRSDEPEVREEALDAPWGNIWHQGTVYEASSYAVPFLIELLTAPGAQCRTEILGLLRALGTGSSYHHVHQYLVVPRAERTTAEFQECLSRELEWVRAAETAVRSGVPLYLGLLSDSDTRVRTTTPHLLACCSDYAAEAAPALLARVEAEADPAARASVLLALTAFDKAGALAENASADYRARLSGIMCNREEKPLARLVSAHCMVHLDAESALDDALPVFRATVEGCGDSFETLPWLEDASPISAVSDALTPWPDVRRDWLLELLDRSAAATRRAAAAEIHDFCRRERSGPEAVLPHLTHLVADPDPEVRGIAARALPRLGKARSLAEEPLRLLAQHPDDAVRALAAETLENVRGKRDRYDLENWLRKPKRAAALCDRIGLSAITVARMTATLERSLGSKKWADQTECANAAARLEWIGPAARRAVPVLRRALEHEDLWVRVRAARALWKITGEPGEALPVLVQELGTSPPGLLAADCLGDMGPVARSAVPALERIVQSETRLVEMGTDDEWIDVDEALQTAAQKALRRIQTAATTP